MSEYPKFKSKYIIDGFDNELKQEDEVKYKKPKQVKRKHRPKLYKQEEDKGNTFRGALISYGNVKVIKAKCPSCNEVAFVSSSFTFLCCGRAYEHEPVATEREVSHKEARRKPKYGTQLRSLKRQRNRCLYCDRTFGQVTKYYGENKIVRVHWDHFIPYSYTQSCKDEHFVAACCFCNRWKYNKIFKTLDDVRDFVAEYWQDTTS